MSQAKISQNVKEEKVSPFGERLLLAFNNAPKGVIAQILGVRNSAITNYIQGRIPDAETLIKISDFTNCSIHWLVTGNGGREVDFLKKQISFDELLEQKIRQIISKIISETDDNDTKALLSKRMRAKIVGKIRSENAPSANQEAEEDNQTSERKIA